MYKKLLSGVLACAMMFGVIASAAETTETAPTTDTVAQEQAQTTNLDPAKGDLMINGVMLLDANGLRAQSLEEAVNIPEGFFESKEYLDTLTPAEPEKEVAQSFPDVNATHNHFAAIEEMKKNGYIVGYEDGSFRPENNISRAEFIKVLVEKDGGTGSVPDGTLTGFVDVDTEPPHWAQKYIALGVQKGYLVGMGDGTFAPDAPITYEQAMKILVCYFGKEVSAKAIASAVLPLWPNAYIVTGQQLQLNLKINLSIGMQVNRGEFAQMLCNGIKTVNTKVNNPITGGGSSGGGGGGGGGGTSDDETIRLTGVVVSIDGISIDPAAETITSPAYIVLRYVDSSTMQTKYIRLREPYDESNRGGKNLYAKYLGYEVTVWYVEDVSYNEIIKFSDLNTTKEITISYEDFESDKTIASAQTDSVSFYYRNEKNNIKEVKLPKNLDDMSVVYNGVTIDAQHPSADHDFQNDTSYIKITDLLPKNGTVTFVNRDGGEAELAIVKTYDTLVPKSGPSSGVVTDKYDETKRYSLTKEKLLSDIKAKYGTNRQVELEDITVNLYKKSTGISGYTEAELTQVKAKSALTIYASRDMTRLDVYICDQTIGSSSTGTKVTASYDEDEKIVKLESTNYRVSDYLINNVNLGRYNDIEDVSDLFPLSEYVVAYIDIFDEITDIVVKEPSYVYGYLADVDYEEGNTAETSFFNFRIITSDNYTQYSNEEKQTYSVRANGKITVDGVTYKYDSFEELASALAANARIINYGDPGKNIPGKDSEMIVHATYAQPIRFVTVDNSKEIKTIITMTPYVAFTKNSETYTCSKAYYIGDEMIGSSAVVFSVPDDRYDYESYVVKNRSYIQAYKKYNPEIYREANSTGTGYINNCVVLYDESINGKPSIESKLTVIKSVEYYDRIDDEDVYKVTAYQASSISAKSEITIYVTDDERITNNKHVKFDVGDVIVYGTTKIGSLNAIKNPEHVVDVSERSVAGFDKRYDRYGNVVTSDSPYYWFRYGTVVNFDANNDTMYLDVGEDELMLVQGTGLFFSTTSSSTLCKPIYFYADENGEPDIAQNTGDRFSSYTLEDMVDTGDMILMYATGTTNIQKSVYLIPGTDRDELYKKDTSEETTATVTFKVATEGATVTFCGKTVNVEDGKAVFENISPDIYTYKVSADNHESYSDWLIVRNGVLTYEVKGSDGNPISLTRHFGGVRFNVYPGNATVTIDGKPPITGINEDELLVADFSGLDVGTLYNYSVTADGYQPANGTFKINKNGDFEEIDIDLEPILYTVNITVDSPNGAPNTATVAVNGKTVIVTSGTGSVQLAVGEYSYTVTAEGFATYTDSVTVTSEGENSINVLLSAIIPEVVFSGLPEGAVVKIGNDSKTVGEDGSVTFANVTDGAAYTITADGYETASGNVDGAELDIALEPTV